MIHLVLHVTVVHKDHYLCNPVHMASLTNMTVHKKHARSNKPTYAKPYVMDIADLCVANKT